MREERALDDELVLRAQQGDTTAFERLAARQMTDLYRIASAMVGAADAGDLTQDALVAAWQELPRLRRADRFVPWLRRIVVNKCRNHLRSRARHPGVNLLEPGPMAADDLGAAQLRLEAMDALAELSDAQRAVVVLHYLVGLTMREVASTLEIPLGTAQSRLHAALQTLRGRLEEVTT